MRPWRCSSERCVPARAIAQWSRWIAAAFVATLASQAGGAGEVESPDRVAVVVGTSSSVRSVTIETLRQVFLRRQRLWPDGTPALPVNLPADSAVRATFSRRVLGRQPTELESYWSRLYFDGIRPPPVLRTGQAVCAYVGVERSAIGYVAPHDVDAKHCRVVLLLGDDEQP